MRHSPAALLLAVSLLFACNRPGPPSEEYAQAREQWSALVKASLDQAAAAPEAADVLALLAMVDPKSVDAPFAAELKQEIETARANLKAAEESKAKALAEAQAALEQPVKFDSDRQAVAEPATPAEPVATAAPDAGAEQPKIAEGMDAAEFKAQFARCFEYKNDSLVGGLAGGEVWGMKDLSICRELHADMVGKSVLLYRGKLDAIRPADELAPKKYVLVEGKLVPLEEAERLKKEAEAKAQAAAQQAPPTAP